MSLRVTASIKQNMPLTDAYKLSTKRKETGRMYHKYVSPCVFM